MHRYDIFPLNSFWNFEERIKVLISSQMHLAKKAAFFLRMFVLISDFWEAFLGSNFWINFLISSVLVSLNLKVLDMFLVLINLILWWFWYFLMILETGFSSDESKLSYSWFLCIFLIEILRWTFLLLDDLER